MANDPATQLNVAMSKAVVALRKVTPTPSTSSTQVILGAAASSLSFAGAIAVFGSVAIVPVTIASALATGVGCSMVLVFRAFRRRTNRNRALIAHLDEACEIAEKAESVGASKKKIQDFANKILDQAQREMFGQTPIQDDAQVDDDETNALPGVQPVATKRLKAGTGAVESKHEEPTA